MDKPVLIIEMSSHLSTEAIVEIHDFLHGLIQSFETHYCYQPREHYKTLTLDDDIDDLF